MEALILEDFELRNGLSENEPGGALESNCDDLTVRRIVFRACQSNGGFGGAIHNRGVMIAQGCLFVNCIAVGADGSDGGGGGSDGGGGGGGGGSGGGGAAADVVSALRLEVVGLLGHVLAKYEVDGWLRELVDGRYEGLALSSEGLDLSEELAGGGGSLV